MLEVKVILHNANTGEVSEIGRMVIINDGSGTGVGNYTVSGWHEPPPARGRIPFTSRVEGHDRRKPVWQLVAKAVEHFLR